MDKQNSFLDSRFLLACFWSIFGALAIGYVLIHYGDKIEILTLVFGTISGTIIGGIFGVYFNSSPDKKNSQESTISKPTIKNINEESI